MDNLLNEFKRKMRMNGIELLIMEEGDSDLEEYTKSMQDVGVEYIGFEINLECKKTEDRYQELIDKVGLCRECQIYQYSKCALEIDDISCDTARFVIYFKK